MIRWSVPILLALASLAIGFSLFLTAKLLLQRVPEKIGTKKEEGTRWTLRAFPLSGPRALWAFLSFSALLILVFVDLDLGAWALLFVAAIWSVKEWGPRWKARSSHRKRLQAIEDLFPQSLGMAIQALKIGQTIPQVLVYLSQESPAPMSEEWERVCSEIKLGSSPEDALTQMAARLRGLEVIQKFVEAYRISRQTGANLTRLLEVLLEGMEEKSRILRRMKSMTAQARLSGLLMGSLPFFLGLVFFILDPGMMTPLFTEKLGWGILLTAVLLETAGFLWIRQLLRLEV